MPPLEYPLALYRGDSYRWQFRLWADEEKTQPSDLVGVVGAASIHLTTGPGIANMVVTVTQPNVVDVALPASESKNLAPSPSIWDLELTYPSGDVKTVVTGLVTVRADATR